MDVVADALPALTSTLPAAQAARIAGLGIAAPFQLWNWSADIGAPPGAMDSWRDFSIVEEIARICPYPVMLCNDATSACAAEFFFGEAWRERDFLYFFIGAFLGGGLVLEGALFPGRTGNAAALGSMPIAMPGRDAPSQLIACASIYQLEKRIESAGRDPSSIWRSPDAWDDYGELLEGWIDEAAYALAQASIAALSVIDVAAIVIEGAMPKAIRQKIRDRVAAEMETQDRRGLSDARILCGAVGAGLLGMLDHVMSPTSSTCMSLKKLLWSRPPITSRNLDCGLCGSATSDAVWSPRGRGGVPPGSALAHSIWPSSRLDSTCTSL